MDDFTLVEVLESGSKLDLCICKNKYNEERFGLLNKETNSIIIVGDKETLMEMAEQFNE